MPPYLKWAAGLLCTGLALYFLINAWFANPCTGESQPQQVSQVTAETALNSALDLWDNGQYQQAELTFGSIDSVHLPQVALYQFYANQFLTPTREQLASFPASCRQKILFVTAEIRSLEQSEKFKLQFAKDKRLQSLPICIHPVTWFNPKSVDCDENWQDLGRLGCDIKPLAEQIKSERFTHLVIFARKGKANVHNGIMFLDEQDTYDVFVHELAHFSGFVDEYPLSKNLANRVCTGADAPNIQFKQAAEDMTTSQFSEVEGRIVSFTPARTCDNHSAQALKASSKLTFMEYHDTAYIPQYYLKAWYKRLQDPHNQPSAHVNFAQLYEELDNHKESQFWLKRYQRYLTDI